jgi:hypothetical protein
MQTFEFFHGVVLSKLVHGYRGGLTISQFALEDNAAYTLNDVIGLYVKYSTSRLSPWIFTFSEKHQETFELLKSRHEKVFLTLVCNEDGVACIGAPELEAIFTNESSRAKSIRVDRPQGGSYRVRGSDGRLERKVSRASFPRLVLESVLDLGKISTPDRS